MDKINADVFLKVAETGSFRKAADELGYTQAGISYIIAAMEKETGLNLFVREHSGVRLSQEGTELLPHMKQLANWERQFEQTVAELNGLKRGQIKVQIFDSISVHWIPDIISWFQEDYPGIKIELITEEDSAKAEGMVRSGEVDCGFFLTDVSSDIEHFPLLEENLMVILPENHKMAAYDRFPIKELGKHPYIGMKYDAHTGIEAIFHKNKVQPQLAFALDNDYAALAMVRKGLGFAIFPELLLSSNVMEGLKSMEFDKAQKRVISIGTASMESCSKATLKFIEYTRRWVANSY
jgi:DNA-binding transcriptional LysR family regulator